MKLAARAFPLPEIDFEPLAPFWKAASVGELRLPRCVQCGSFDWYPSGACPRCGGSPEWVKLSGRATLFSWSIVRRALHPPLAPIVPYVSAIVVLAEDTRTRLVTRIIDADPLFLEKEMALKVRFVDLAYPMAKAGLLAPLFTPTQRRGEW